MAKTNHDHGPMRKLTTACLVFALIGGVVGCGSGSSSNQSTSPTTGAQTKLRPSAVSAHSGIPSFWNADTRAHCTTAQYGSGWCRASVTQQCNATPENQEEKELSEAACSVLREVPATSEHTSEEEAAHNKSLETQRRGEEQSAAAQKKVEEAETQGGEHSIRKVEEKVCFESGKTAEECKGPLKETPQEEHQLAEKRAEQRQGEEEGGTRVAPTPGCQTGGCVE